MLGWIAPHWGRPSFTVTVAGYDAMPGADAVTSSFTTICVS